MSRAQRMQLKAFLCVLGFLLIIVLLIGKLLAVWLRGGQEETPEPEPHIPVTELITNVWIMESDEEGLLLFRDGSRQRYPWGAAAEGDAQGQQEPEEVPEIEENPGGKRYYPGTSVREQLADVELTDGKVTLVEIKTEKINGKILGADSGWIEVEGYGRLPLASDYKGYRLYDSLEMCTAGDLLFGYSNTDLCMENGEICGILMVKEEVMQYIRVLIRASDYSGLFHEQPRITCDTDFTVVYGPYENRKQENHKAWEEVSFDYDSAYFETQRIYVIPDVLTGKVIFQNCNRSQGIPSYRGHMEFLKTEEGIVAVNEVLLEEYLYSVVPSEMPAYYPFEALRAQAVCARTYAYGGMTHAGYPRYGAHVDDSTSYQVYNNVMEQENATTAVKETYGQFLRTKEGKTAGTYYYSTSCGVGSDATVWKTEEAPTLTYLKAKFLSRSAMAEEIKSPGNNGEGNGPAEGEENGGSGADAGEKGDSPVESMKDEETFASFIRSVNPDDFEAAEGWYRWTYEADSLNRERLLEVLQKRYAANSRLILTWKDGEYVSEEIYELDDVTDIYIEKRGSGGVADELILETDSRKIKVISEHNIRYVLNNGESEVVLQDGSRIAGLNLLPSGFFILTAHKENGTVTGYSLTGGGFGHGAGMSQNGAKEMAKEGYRAEEILLYFFEGCVLENIYE